MNSRPVAASATAAPGNAVQLTPADLLLAGMSGLMRAAENIKLARRDAYGARDNPFGIHVVGAIGEYVAARALGLPWSGKGLFRGADVGLDLQVRTVLWRPTVPGVACLILHPPDADALRYVLVVGWDLDWDVIGWCWGREGKLPAYWRDPAGGRPAFFVPPEALRPLADLRLGEKGGSR